MIVAAAVLAGVLGLGAGWFANVLIDRVPKKESLRPFPPLYRAGLPARYLIVEVAVAGLFVATVFRFESAAIPAYFVFFTALVAVSVIDLDLHIIPNRIVYPTIFVSIPLLAVAAAIDDDFDSLETAVIGAVLAWAALFVIHLVSPAGMGFGDVRLSFILGLFLGWLTLSHVAVGLFMGFLLGAVIGVGLVVSRVRSRKDAIPFGPFLAGGAALTVFVGSPIIHWWLRT
jgi:leader peptidase (prepilin peptidase)/N-methyltransferase